MHTKAIRSFVETSPRPAVSISLPSSYRPVTCAVYKGTSHGPGAILYPFLPSPYFPPAPGPQPNRLQRRRRFLRLPRPSVRRGTGCSGREHPKSRGVVWRWQITPDQQQFLEAACGISDRSEEYQVDEEALVIRLGWTGSEFSRLITELEDAGYATRRGEPQPPKTRQGSVSRRQAWSCAQSR